MTHSPLSIGVSRFDVEFIQPVQWSDAYLIGVPLVDMQHKRLFELIEELRVSYFRRKSQEVISKTMNGVLSYCAEHFESEELLLRAVDYPELAAHADIHRNFTETVNAWFEDSKRGTLDAKLMLRTLNDWLVNHVLCNDTKYTEYCRNRHLRLDCIHSVDDLIEIMQEHRHWWYQEKYFGFLLVMLLLPPVALYCLLAFWLTSNATARYSVASACLVLLLLCDATLVAFVHAYVHEQHRRSQSAHARQLAENLVAGEIASRIAVMDFTNVSEYFKPSDGFLLQTMKEIVSHLQSFVPYIPSTLLSLLRGEDDEEDDEDGEDGGGDVGGGEGYTSPNIVPHIRETLVEYDLTSRSENVLVSSSSRNSQKSDRSIKSARLSTSDRPLLGDDSRSSHSGGTTGRSTVSRASDRQAAYHLPIAAPTPTMFISPPSDRSCNNSTGRKAAAGGLPSTSSRRKSGSNCSNSNSNSSRKPSAGNACGKGGGMGGAAPGMSTLGLQEGRRGVKLDMLERWLQRKSISLLVCHIRDFSELLFAKTPQDVLDLHARYISIVEDVCKATRAVFDSMTGDRVVLSWNTTNFVGNHGEQACTGALKLRDCFHETSGHSCSLSMAISSAVVVIGNMGSKTKLGFSILGDVPPFVDALCELSTHVKAEIVVTSQTWREVKDMFVGKLLGPVDLTKPEVGFPMPDSGVRPSTSRRRTLVDAPTTLVSSTGTTITTTTTSSSSSAAAALEEVPSMDVSPTASLISSQATAGRPSSPAATLPPAKLFVVELKGAARREVDEWMYAIQDASRNNPYAEYNDMLAKVYNSSSSSSSDGGVGATARAQLKEYVREHPEDTQAAVTHSICEHWEGNHHCPMHLRDASWKCGWIFQ